MNGPCLHEQIHGSSMAVVLVGACLKNLRSGYLILREMILMTDFWQGMFPAIFKKSEFEFTFWLTIIILCNLHCSKTYQLRQSTTSIGYNLVIPHGVETS